jgi:hypothetical protein
MGGPVIDHANAIEPSRGRRVLQWIADHDDSKLFIILYVGLGLVLSMTISLFWLVAVVAAHALLEWYAMGSRGVFDHRAGRVLWHLKLDIGLVLVALWLGLYIEVIFGIAGLGAVARAGAQATARVIAWQRALRGFLVTVDEMAHVAKAVVVRKRPKGAKAPEIEVVDNRPPWRQQWTRGDKFAVVFTLTWVVLILLTPVFTDHTVASTLAVLAGDLHPWPSD